MTGSRLLTAVLLCLGVLAPAAYPLAIDQLGVPGAAQPPSPAGPARAAAVKEWTVLVYVSARNNLGLEGLKDVNEMEAAGSTGKVNVVVELGRIKCDPPFNPFVLIKPSPPPQADWTGSRRFLLVKDTDTLTVTSPVLAHYPDADMGDWRHLAEFIAWGKAAYPAKKYMLIVSGHGGGWRGVKPPPGTPRGISYDDVSGNHISPAELGEAIKAGGGVNVYGSDACLMQTVEVIYELRDGVDYVVGSQETTPGSGYNYEVFLNALAEKPGDALTAARSILAGFTGYYGSLNQSVTMSIVRPALAAELAVKLDKFSRLVAASPEDMRLYQDKKFGLRGFADEDARDLYQLMRLYYDNTPTPAIKEQAADIMNFLARSFVAQNEAVGYKSKDANGVSVYFPVFDTSYRRAYEYLGFSRDTFWDEMLRAVMAVKK